MKEYDMVFLHPSRNFKKDLSISKKRATFVQQYPILPMGVFSLASLLQKEGYAVKIVNLGLEKFLSPSFDVERCVKSLRSKIYGIDLHWAVHSAGAIQLADMCKRNNPDSLVVVGGFTATWFSKEILQKYHSIDVIVLGEAEQNLTGVVRAHLTGKTLSEVRGVTYRVNNKVRRNPIRCPPSNLEDFDFTELPLLENWEKYLRMRLNGSHTPHPYFWLTIARGCTYDCIHCGGSRSSYKLLTQRQKPIFRSPGRVAEDIRKLYDLGVVRIYLSHDPEIGGKRYWSELLEEIGKSGVDVAAYWESFRVPSKAFLQKMGKVFYELKVAVSPESPSEEVRELVGKGFTNAQLFEAINVCEDLGVAMDLYFIAGLPGETLDFYKSFRKIADHLSGKLWTALFPPIRYTIDPNCIMAINPERYGLKLYFKTFEDYKTHVIPSANPLNHIGHETTFLSREKIFELTEKAKAYAMSLPPPLMRKFELRWF